MASSVVSTASHQRRSPDSILKISREATAAVYLLFESRVFNHLGLGSVLWRLETFSPRPLADHGLAPESGPSRAAVFWGKNGRTSSEEPADPDSNPRLPSKLCFW